MSQLEKPLLRGSFHKWGFFFSIPLFFIALWIALQQTGPHVVWVSVIYSTSLCALLGTSALYHRIDWSDENRLWMRRLDRTMIFVLIAGTYTPLGVLVYEGIWNTRILWTLWILVVLGFFMNMVWVQAPKWIRSVLYIAAGWLSIFSFPQIFSKAHSICGALLLGGGIVYTIGAVFYAAKRPNPIPGVLGYHELFHIMVLIAALMHYVAIVGFVLPLP